MNSATAEPRTWDSRDGKHARIQFLGELLYTRHFGVAVGMIESAA